MTKTVTAAQLCAKAKELLHLLRGREERFCTAESCTGGLIAKAITDLSGSSSVFSGAFVTYTNEVKINVLGVPGEVIAKHTEVSLACAEEMAKAARERMQCEYALSTTGVAGPTGGDEKNPVGTVYIAVATPEGVYSERFCAPLGATRTGVRTGAAFRAMELLCQRLEGSKIEKI